MRTIAIAPRSARHAIVPKNDKEERAHRLGDGVYVYEFYGDSTPVTQRWAVGAAPTIIVGTCGGAITIKKGKDGEIEAVIARPSSASTSHNLTPPTRSNRNFQYFDARRLAACVSAQLELIWTFRHASTSTSKPTAHQPCGARPWYRSKERENHWISEDGTVKPTTRGRITMGVRDSRCMMKK